MIPAPGISIDTLVAAVPADAVSYKVVAAESLPRDRVFRNAWCACPDEGCKVDLAKAREITHNIRREKRAAEFAPCDDQIAQQIPGVDLAVVEQIRAGIRAKYETIQASVDIATSVDELKTIIEGM
jgi:hypothetical protein